MKHLIHAIALVAAVSGPLACVAESPSERVTSVSNAIVTTKDLPAYNFTALHFTSAQLTANLVSVDPEHVPIAFSLAGVDETGKQQGETAVELVAIDAKAGVATYKRVSGDDLGLYFDVTDFAKPEAQTKAYIAFTPSWNLGWLFNCYTPPGRKPPNPSCVPLVYTNPK